MKKEELRTLYKNKRQLISSSEIESLSQQIFKNITTNFNLIDKKISLFLPIAKQNEVNTFILLEQLNKKNTIAISKSNFKSFELCHFIYESKKQLQPNQFGIPEPIFGNAILEKDLDIVFVPLLAFNEQGFRVGYGKGFYDRFLKKCSPKCIFIGLTFFEEIEDFDDINEHDIQLNYCVTPSKIIEFKPV
jgi:5-formyltetrahydrofolate cyclo-ligase